MPALASSVSNDSASLGSDEDRRQRDHGQHGRTVNQKQQADHEHERREFGLLAARHRGLAHVLADDRRPGDVQVQARRRLAPKFLQDFGDFVDERRVADFGILGRQADADERGLAVAAVEQRPEFRVRERADPRDDRLVGPRLGRRALGQHPSALLGDGPQPRREHLVDERAVVADRIDLGADQAGRPAVATGHDHHAAAEEVLVLRERLPVDALTDEAVGGVAAGTRIRRSR